MKKLLSRIRSCISRRSREARSERIRAAAERVADDYAETFEKLAK